MNKSIKSHHHCVYKLTYHLVLVTKYRKKCFTSAMLDQLKIIITELCIKWDIELIEFNGEADHVHLLIDMHPNIMPSKFINNLKTVSSRLIRKAFADHLAHIIGNLCFGHALTACLQRAVQRLIRLGATSKSKSGLDRPLCLHRHLNQRF